MVWGAFGAFLPQIIIMNITIINMDNPLFYFCVPEVKTLLITKQGSYPFEAVKLMKSIVIEAEGTVFYQTVFKDLTDVLSDNGVGGGGQCMYIYSCRIGVQGFLSYYYYLLKYSSYILILIF